MYSYDVMSEQQPRMAPVVGANPMVHQHPWPSTGAMTMDSTKQWMMDNKLYLAGGAAVVLGLVAWKMRWFR